MPKQMTMLTLTTGSSTAVSGPKHWWNFVTADVPRPLLGADFLCFNSLLVNLKGKRFVDAATYMYRSARLHSTRATAPHLDAISISTDQYDFLLTNFPEIITANFVQSPTKHGIQHLISTKGPPSIPAPAVYPQTS